MRFAELTEVETGIVYTFNTDKIRAVVRQPIPLVGKDGSPEWGPVATFVWGLDPGCFTHIPDDPRRIYLNASACPISSSSLATRAVDDLHFEALVAGFECNAPGRAI